MISLVISNSYPEKIEFKLNWSTLQLGLRQIKVINMAGMLPSLLIYIFACFSTHIQF